MAVTTSTSVTNIVMTEVIDDLMIPYQYDRVTAVPFFRYKSLINVPTNVASFPRAVKDTTTDVATETTSLVPQEYLPTQVSATCSRIGIARELSETSIEDNIRQKALWTLDLVEDAAILLGEAIDEDAMALFANAGNAVSNTGVAITILDLVEAMGLQRAARCHAPQVIHMHHTTLKQLQRAQVAATATPWATFYEPNADETNYGGRFMNQPVWSSSLNPTNTSAADRVGCVWAQGQIAPKWCAFGFANKRLPTTKYDEDILEDTHIMATYIRVGFAAVATNFATKLVFDA